MERVDGGIWIKGSPMHRLWSMTLAHLAGRSVRAGNATFIMFDSRAMAVGGNHMFFYAPEQRVAIEATSRGTTANGDLYAQQYHFLLRARDGKIIEWREYMDTELARKVLIGD